MTRKTRKNVEVADIPPPFCRQGNKFPMRQEIIGLIPQHNIYVEPFLGSGAIFYNKPPASQNILNDLDKHTYNQHKLLKSAPTNPDLYPKGLNTIESIKKWYKRVPQTAAEKLIHEKIEACNGFSGSPVRMSYGIHRKADPTKILKNLDFYQSRLKAAKILNKDYSTIVKTYDSPATFFFFDPPYEKTRAIYGYGQHKDFNYEQLVEVLRSIRGKFLLTINDSPRMREIFKEFHTRCTKVYARWSRKTKRSEDRRELLVMNYYTDSTPL